MNSNETKTELPPDEDAKRLRLWVHSFPWLAGIALRIELRNKELGTLRTRLEAAEKANGELVKDKERLDWLSKHTFPSAFGVAQESCYAVQLWDAENLRQAIDAAMKATAEALKGGV